MEIKSLLKPIILISLILTAARLIATYYFDLPNASTDLLVFIDIPFMLTYTIIALREIYGSSNISLIEKIMWTIGFLPGLSMWIALIYLFLARERILRVYKLLYVETESFTDSVIQH
jgi:phosphate/sulfate permease